METTDAELATRIAAAAREPDRDAEAELCRRFGPRARLYGLRHLRDEAAAADLAQEALLVTLERLRAGELREPEKVASFVLGTCRMLARDGRRGHDRRERLLEGYRRSVDLVALPEETPVDRARLQDCFRGLGERERSVLVLTFYVDRPADEVARELGLTAGNVRVIRHRALACLRACLGEPEEPR